MDVIHRQKCDVFMHNSALTFRERDSGSQDWDSAEKKTGIIVTSLTLAV